MNSRWRWVGSGIGVLVAAACGGGTSGPSTGTIQGAVLDTAGAPLEEVTVLLRNAGTSTTIRGVASNPSGSYTMLGVPAGSFDVVVQVPPAMQGVTSTLVTVAVSGGDTAYADFTLRFLPVSFANHVQALFTASCAGGGCHATPAPQQGMDLSAGQAYANTVNVAAMELGTMDRIEPGKPDSSYLVHKIDGTHQTVGGQGARMPSGAPPLPLQTRRMVRRWVTDGAQNN